MLAVADIDGDATGQLAQRTRAITGSSAGLVLHMLPPGDPIAGFQTLARAFPNAVLASPVNGSGGAPWFREACRFEGLPHPVLLFAVDEHDLAPLTSGEVRERAAAGHGWWHALRGPRPSPPAVGRAPLPLWERGFTVGH